MEQVMTQQMSASQIMRRKQAEREIIILSPEKEGFPVSVAALPTKNMDSGIYSSDIDLILSVIFAFVLFHVVLFHVQQVHIPTIMSVLP